MVPAGAGGSEPGSVTWVPAALSPGCLRSCQKQVNSALWTAGPALGFCVGKGENMEWGENLIGKLQPLKAPGHGAGKDFGKFFDFPISHLR